jgi:pyrimidine-nucleoside phosphorylase
MNLKSHQLINNFLELNSEANMQALVDYAREFDLTDDEIVLLAKGLAYSGSTCSFKNEKLFDIPSTGGPASLSTLLCPLFLKVLGNKVLKLGVPGRPAGGIDVLNQINGYNVNPNNHQIEKWLYKNNYVHFLANSNFTPADARLFSFRKNNNALDIQALVISSLLSKKIAVGLTHVGLDIRVSNFGNFGKTWDEARQNGLRFNRIASILDIESKCFLTNGDIPQQPYIGRGESILALNRIFTKSTDNYLLEHLEQCFIMANSISAYKSNNGYSIDDVREAFYDNVKTQEGLISSFEEIAQNVDSRHKYNIYANEDGILSINLEVLRKSILNTHSKSAENFPDNCGIILKVKSNAYVRSGEIICTFRCEDKYKEAFENDLNHVFAMSSNKVDINNFEEII